MRADRLVATLLLLQARGQLTAAEVAAELEVSQRTARRDLEALGVAGLPVYSQPGRNGGWRLAGAGRTDLSGLTAAETRALFLVAGTSSTTPEVKAALRKLVRALPAPFRDSAQVAQRAVVVDPVGWDRPTRRPRPPAHLDAIQRAVVESEQIRLGYVARDGANTSRVVHPLGLVSKGSTWYLVADTETGLRTFRVDRVTETLGLGDAAVRPPGFDLDEAWRSIADEVDQRRAPLRVRAAASPEIVQLLRWVLGTRVAIGPAERDGRIGVELRGQDARSLAGEIAGFGAHLEVFEPQAVRDQLLRIGHELSATYGHR